MSLSVHKADTGFYEMKAKYTPPFPKEIPTKGFPVLFVETNYFVFQFSSRYELKRCIEVLSQKHLPSLHEEMDSIRNQHWLNRLPASVKAWNHREKIVKYLEEVLEQVEKENIL